MTGKAGNPCVTWPFSLLRDVCEKPETGAQGIQAVNGIIPWAPLLEKQALMTHCFFKIKVLFVSFAAVAAYHAKRVVKGGWDSRRFFRLL